MQPERSLRELLEVETSRRNTDFVAGLIDSDPLLFAELADLFFQNIEPFSRRSAWVMDVVAERHHDLLLPYLVQIIDHLPMFRHDGLKRESLRMLVRYPIPEERKGVLMNLCFGWLLRPSESISVKVYSMDLLYRLSESEPDIKNELADSIEWRMEEESAGFRAHGKKILKKLRKELRNLQS
jgi:hypothetical protein